MNRSASVFIALFFLGFGFFVQSEKWLAFLFLGLGISWLFWSIRNLSYEKILVHFGLSKNTRHLFIYLATGLITAIGLAMYYRHFQSEDPILSSLSPFVMVAVAIGLTEELIYRGYFYTSFHRHPLIALLLAAIAHAGYKSSIFLSAPGIDVVRLGMITFLVGIFIGLLRLGSSSILPCLLFHMVFDFCVYGDKETPWWVW